MNTLTTSRTLACASVIASLFPILLKQTSSKTPRAGWLCEITISMMDFVMGAKIAKSGRRVFCSSYSQVTPKDL